MQSRTLKTGYVRQLFSDRRLGAMLGWVSVGIPFLLVYVTQSAWLLVGFSIIGTIAAMLMMHETRGKDLKTDLEA